MWDIVWAGICFKGDTRRLSLILRQRRTRTVLDYIPLNRTRAAFLDPGKKLSDFPWSSFFAMIGTPRECPGGLEVERFVKIALAAFFKSRTVVTNLWISRRL